MALTSIRIGLLVLLLASPVLSQELVTRIKRESEFKWSVVVPQGTSWWGSQPQTAAVKLDEKKTVDFTVLPSTRVSPSEELAFRQQTVDGPDYEFSEITTITFGGCSAAYQFARFSGDAPLFQAIVARKERRLLVRGLDFEKSDIAVF